MAGVRIDLHVHSNASDGTDSPADVVRRAKGWQVAEVVDLDETSATPVGERRTRDENPRRERESFSSMAVPNQ